MSSKSKSRHPFTLSIADLQKREYQNRCLKPELTISFPLNRTRKSARDGYLDETDQ